MNNKGEIVAKHWKERNIKGVFPGFELFTTTVYDVLDRYVEMYGRDAVIPITRTPLGNITTTAAQREPELFRAMALKGAEIFLRTASGGFQPLDIQACALYNGVYSSVVNNSVSPDNKYESKYPPNLWSEYLPTSLEDAGRYVRDKSRWK